MTLPIDDPRRCRAHSSRTGERCRKSAMVGQRVCAAHGGRSPKAKQAAFEKLRELEHPAIRGLKRALASDDMAAVVRASRDVLDRLGHRTGVLPADRVRASMAAATRAWVEVVMRWVPDAATRRLIAHDLAVVGARYGADRSALAAVPPTPDVGEEIIL